MPSTEMDSRNVSEPDNRMELEIASNIRISEEKLCNVEINFTHLIKGGGIV